MYLKKVFLCLMLAAVVVAFGATMAQAAPLPKVTICHIPPGNPDNAHTITISENALQAHINNHDESSPGAMSATDRVPPGVPSLIHSSRPWTPSSAEKKTCPSLQVR
jgi:hypothetical protein